MIIPNARLAYLATPYTEFPGGIHVAFDAAVRLAGDLMRAGVSIYSPIVHCHPIACRCGIDPRDADFWLQNQAVMMRAADVLIVAELPGWNLSLGVADEIETFRRAGKLVFRCNPATLLIRRDGAPAPVTAAFAHGKTRSEQGGASQ